MARHAARPYILAFSAFCLLSSLSLWSYSSHFETHRQRYLAGLQDHLPAAFTGRRPSCSTLPSTSPSFLLEICHHPSLCNRGFLRVSRTDSVACSTLESLQAADDPAENERIKRLLGPDTFRVSLDGGTRWAREARGEGEVRYKGRCVYEWDFDVSESGSQLKASIEWFWTDYMGYYERQPWVYATSGRMQLLAGAPYAVPKSMCPPWQHSQSLARPLRLRDTDPNAFLQVASLPPCPRSVPLAGRYLPSALEDRNRTYGGFTWQPEGCRWGEVPEAGMSAEEVKQRWTGRTSGTLFLGDSHLRYLHHYYQAVFKQDAAYIASPQQTKDAFDTAEFHPGGMNVTFAWSTHLTLPTPDGVVTCESVKGFDRFVVSAGHHFLVNNQQAPVQEYHIKWSEDAYAQRVASALRWLESCSATPDKDVKIVFVGPPAYRPPLTKSPSYDMDRRQNRRIAAYTDAAFRALAAVRPGTALVDQYARTHPLLWDNPIDFHFFGTDAMHAMTQEIAWKLEVEDRTPLANGP